MTILWYIVGSFPLWKWVVFNSIQVTNYWFILHRALRLLHQQAQIFSPNIWGISDQNVTIDSIKYAFWLKVWKVLDNWAIKDKFSFWVVKKKPVKATYCCKNKSCSWRCWVWKNLNEMLILTIIEAEHNCIEAELEKKRTVSSHVWLNKTVFKHLNIIKTTSSKAIVKCIHIHYSEKISYKIAQLTQLHLLSEDLSNQQYSF